MGAWDAELILSSGQKVGCLILCQVDERTLANLESVLSARALLFAANHGWRGTDWSQKGHNFMQDARPRDLGVRLGRKI